MSEPRRGTRLLVVLIILVSVAVVLLWMSGKARAEDPLVVTFGGGISKRATDFTLKTNQAVSAINLDIENGSISKRGGFWQAAAGVYGGLGDSTMRVYGLRKRDGSQRLLRILGDSAENWNDVWVGTLAGVTKKDAFLFRGGDYGFTTWRDYAFITDGYNFPWVTSGDTSTGENHSLHIPAPGEMYVEVLDDTNSSLDGTYRWSILAWPGCDTTTEYWTGLTDTALARVFSRHVGYITPEVTVHHRKVALHLFWPQVADSGCAEPLPLKFWLLRTKADHTDLSISNEPPVTVWENISSEDSLFVIWTTKTVTTTGYIDTIFVDSGYGEGAGFDLVHEFFDFPDVHNLRGMVDSVKCNGMPRFMEAIMLSDTGDGATVKSGNAYRRYTGDSTAPYYNSYGRNFYAVTLLDTALDVESDTSRTLQLPFGWLDSLLRITIPRMPTDFGTCVRRLYRGTVTTNYDTLTALRLLQELGPNDTVFTDTFSAIGIESTMIDHPVFVGRMHKRFAGTTVWDGRMYGWEGPNLYYSYPDTPSFSLLNSFALNADDGDAITAVVGDRNRLLIYTSNARHELYEDDNGDFSKSSAPYVVSGIGCIASGSMQPWRGARIYLSRSGVVYEVGNALQEKGNQIDTISMGIQPLLDAWPYAERCAAIAFIFDDDRYVLSVPGHDSTFVCFLDEPGFPWVIYTPFSFTGATFYEDDDDYVLRPPVEIIFSKAGTDTLFRWGDSLTDNGDAYTAEYKTGFLGVGPDLSEVYQMLSIGSGPDTGTVTIRFLDENGDTLGSVVLAADTNRLEKRTVKTGKQAQAHQVEIAVDSTVNRFTLDAISLWMRFFGLSGPEK